MPRRIRKLRGGPRRHKSSGNARNRPAAHGLRILRIADIPRDRAGGVHGYMTMSGEALRQRGHEVQFMFREDLASWPRYGGLRRLIIPLVLPIRGALAQRRSPRADVVEIHEPLAAPYSFLASRSRGALPPCVVLSHGLGERLWQETKRSARAAGWRVPLKSRLLVPLTLVLPSRYGLRHAAHVVVLSSEDAEFVRSELRVPSWRVSCAPTGVTQRFFAAPPPTPDASGVRVIFVGTWIERKGIRELCAAWERLCAEDSTTTLTVVGASAQEVNGRLRSEQGRVTALPYVSQDDLPAVLARHDIFVLPTWFEGMPLSVLEAAASALPCIVGATCGNLDIFPPGDPAAHGGILIAPRDSVALASAIRQLRDDPQLRVALGGRARQRARHFSWESTAEYLESAYRRAGNRRHTAGATSQVQGRGPA